MVHRRRKKASKENPNCDKRGSRGIPNKREKEQIALLNNTLPKKIWEAKQRKKKRFVESLKKAQSKSEQIFDNETFTPLAKARQVRQIYRQAMNKNKPKKKEVIVGK